MLDAVDWGADLGVNAIETSAILNEGCTTAVPSKSWLNAHFIVMKGAWTFFQDAV